MIRTTLISAAVLAASAAFASASALTPGNLVVLQATGINPTTGANATGVTLLEYKKDGTLVQTLNVASTGASALTLRGTSTTEGVLSISGDGSLITFGGHRVDAGSANPNNSTNDRVIGKVSVSDFSATGLSTSLSFSGSANYAGDSLRSVLTDNGTNYWLSGAGNSNSGGVRHFDGTTVTALNGSQSSPNSRQAQLIGGQLYVSSGSNVPGRSVFKIGTGAPTSGSPTFSPIFPTVTTPQYQNFFFADLDATANWDSTGFDTLYVTDSNGGDLSKYSFDGTNWTLKNTLDLTGIVGLAGFVNGTNVDLFLTQATTSSGTIQTVSDTAGYNANINGTATGLATPAIAGTNNAFRGIVAVVPEPTSFALLGLAGLVGLRRRGH